MKSSEVQSLEVDDSSTTTKRTGLVGFGKRLGDAARLAGEVISRTAHVVEMVSDKELRK
jgi:hypothetical protein